MLANFRRASATLTQAGRPLSRHFHDKSTDDTFVRVKDYRAVGNRHNDLFHTEDTAQLGVGPAILITCEHAAETLPRPYGFSGSDERLLGTHWSFDPGAADFSVELAEKMGCMAVLSDFSRIIIDPNRPLSSPTLIRTHCDGQPVLLNQEITDMDRSMRILNMYVPYHTIMGQAAEEVQPAVMLSIHSFTADYEGDEREFDIGVLCTSRLPVVETIKDNFISGGFDARLNEPWSGKDGFMFSVDSLKASSPPRNTLAIMLEFRNDLLVQPEWRARAVECMANMLTTELSDWHKAGDPLDPWS